MLFKITGLKSSTQCMQKNKHLLAICLLFSACGHQSGNGPGESNQEVFQSPQSQFATADAGGQAPFDNDKDAGVSDAVLFDSGSSMEANHNPSLDDYPDSPHTTTCSPLYPEDESTISDLTPLFIWETAFGAQEYKFELAKDMNFNELVFVSQLLSEPLTDRYLQLPDAYTLSTNQTYFWRINSVSNNISTLCTGHFSFQTPPN